MTRCEYAIDLHAGDLIEDLTPFVIYRETGEPALDERIRRMADAYGARWAVKSAPTGERPGSLYALAALNGVASMLAESGGRGLLIEEDVVRHVRGVTNILRAIGALDGAPEAVAPPRVVNSFDWLRVAGRRHLPLARARRSAGRGGRRRRRAGRSRRRAARNDQGARRLASCCSL